MKFFIVQSTKLIAKTWNSKYRGIKQTVILSKIAR